MDKSIFPIIIGRKGVDSFFLKYATGEIVPWPTEDELKQWRKEADEDTARLLAQKTKNHNPK